MKHKFFHFIICGIILVGISSCLWSSKDKQKESSFMYVSNKDDIVALFSLTPDKIKERTEQVLKDAQSKIQKIIAIPESDRTFDNTIRAFDHLCGISDLVIFNNVISTLKMVSPDKEIRDTARDAIQKIDEFVVDNISNNVDLYNALSAYNTTHAPQEQLLQEQQYFLKEVLDDYMRSGINLPKDQRAKVAQLKKELTELQQIFSKNIAEDASKIVVTRDDLTGMDDVFINALQKTDDQKYVVTIDYPTYFALMERCEVESTRKHLSRVFSNRAYPQNEDVLKTIIKKRDQLAHVLGYPSFAHLNIDDTMAHTPEVAQKFVYDLLEKVQLKAQQEFELLAKDLPKSVTLTDDGKLKPWDAMYVSAQYKKKHFNLDEQEIAQYFPMQETIDGLLDVYREFLGVDFQEEPIAGMWHEDVRLIKVYSDSSKKQLLGYLVMDLHPRPNKYSHACEIDIIKAVNSASQSETPALVVVIANFAKPTLEKPSLLNRSREVKTFFHEFGHDLNDLLGRVDLAGQAGTSVKLDFVEMPSQMLEEWLYDTEILKKVSKHYQTGKSLPDDLIERIQKLKTFGSGSFVQRQLVLSLISLDYYLAGEEKDPYTIMHNLYQQHSQTITLDKENHCYASFGHLSGYGARYYGYMWSKVFALDLFEEIKKHGLLNPKIGKKYIADVIGKGGSKHPSELLKAFLGREPNQQAFLKDIGLENI